MNNTVTGLFAVLLLAAASQAPAQERFPSKPVQLILPFGAGGSDAMFRGFSQAMSAVTGEQFILINREGASGSIGATSVARAHPDGYTLLVGPTTPITNLPYMQKDLAYQFDSFDPICQVFVNAFMLVVRADSPYKTLAQLLDAARGNPGKFNYGHAGLYTGPHLNMLTLAKQAGIQVQDIPYRGDALILQRLLAGDLQFSVNSAGAVATRPDVRVLAVFWDRRHPALPDVPSVTELGYPSSPPGYQGVFAPKGVPQAVRLSLEKECEKATQNETFKTFAKNQGVPLVFLTGAEFSKLAQADYEDKGKIFKELNVKPQ